MRQGRHELMCQVKCDMSSCVRCKHGIGVRFNTNVTALAKTDSNFPLQLWDKITPQVQDTLNLMHASRLDPKN